MIKGKSTGWKNTIIWLCMVGMLLLLSACQATPEDLIVQSKAGEAFEEAIQETAEEAIGETTEVQHITRTLANDSETSRVVVDADVILPDTDQIPVAEVTNLEITQEQLDKVVKALIKNGQLYNPEVMTKERIETQILNIKLAATDLDSDLAQSNGITNLSELQEYADSIVAELVQQMEDAPSEADIDTSYDHIDVSESIYLSVDLGKEHDAEIFYSNTLIRSPTEGIRSQGIKFFNFGEIGYERSLDSNYAAEIDDDMRKSEGYQTAYATLTDLMDAMQIEDIKLKYEFVSSDSSDASNGESGERIYYPDKEYYVFVFERTFNDVPITSAFYSGGEVEELNGEMDFSKSFPNEKIEVWIEGPEVVLFRWGHPIKTTNILNDNVKINIDIDKALETMANHIMLTYSLPVYGEDKTLDLFVAVDRIELSLACIKQKDSGGEYIVSPVWDFYGDIKIKFTDEHLRSRYGADYFEYLDEDGYIDFNSSFKSLVTVNALDGTIVDRDLGY